MPYSRLHYIAEGGKRSDDYVSRDWGSFISSFLFWRGLSRFRRRRLLPVVIVALLLYLLWTSDLGQRTRGPSATEDEGDFDQASSLYYTGPIRFLRLGYTLHRVKGIRWRNNVLFSAASLKSASAMIPIACEMARYRRNGVHFALLGRDDMSVDELLVKNGIEDGCDVHWHDGRPDHSVSSTDSRMATGVSEALGLINSIMNPWVFIVDNLEEEEAFFSKSIRDKAQSLGRPVLELPRDAVENLMWMTRLDCGSLNAWNRINIEIIIQVSPGASGSLIRLLKSLENADYFSSPPPGLTVELPPSIDNSTLRFLEDFAWPPPRPGKQQSGRLKLRRRLRYDITAEESALRFLESFFPANPSTSHVLVLSPRVELSPLFYHYLKYALLEYKYSLYGFQVSSKLIGIALNLPSTYLNASSPFNPPLGLPPPQDQSHPTPEGGGQATPFLWQAPDSDAALYFGEKWVELQDFLANRLDGLRKSSGPYQRPKATSSKYPSWIEYLSELSRAMGYVMLYPNWESGGSFATAHNELVPETARFTGTSDPQSPEDAQNILATQPSINRRESPLISGTKLVRILPADGDLPELSIIPLLSFDGRHISPSVLDTEAAGYAATFGKEIGGCGADTEIRSAGDLFCLGDRQDEIR